MQNPRVLLNDSGSVLVQVDEGTSESASEKALLALAIALRIPLVTQPMTYLSDTWRQADTASIAHHFLANGFRLFYPQIYWGGIGPGYVECEFQAYPFLVALLYACFGEHVWLGRMLSLFMASATLLVLHKLARLVFGPKAALLSVAFLAVCPLSIRYSVAFMPEATALFFYSSALLLFYRWVNQPAPKLLFLASLATSLSILIKPTSIHIGLVFCALLVRHHGLRALRRWDVILAGCLCLLAPAAWYWHARNLYLTYGNTFGVLSGGDSKFGSPREWFSLRFYASVLQLESHWILGSRFLWTRVSIVAFLSGLWSALRGPSRGLILSGLVTIALYYMIVARYAQENWGIQYHVFMIPYAALLIGEGLRRLSEWSSAFAVPTLTSCLFAIGAGSGAIYADMLHAKEGPLVRCGAAVKTVVPKSEPIIVATSAESTEHGVPNNYQEPTVFFYSDRRGFSLPADWDPDTAIQAFKKAGASFLVVPGTAVYKSNPPLHDFVAKNAIPLLVEEAESCDIFRVLN